VVAFAVLLFEQQPRWSWLVAGFAIWGTSLALGLTAYYMLGIGIGVAAIGLLVGRLIRRGRFIAAHRRFIGSVTPLYLQTFLKFTWSWPWYVTALFAAESTGFWISPPLDQPVAGFLGYSLLEFTVVALVIMLVERVPEMLVFPAGFAAWAIWLWEPSLGQAPLMIAYSLLCALVFASQFTWRIFPSASGFLPATTPHVMLGLGGQALVVLVIIGQGGFSADSGQLVHVGAGALLELAILLFWYERFSPG